MALDPANNSNLEQLALKRFSRVGNSNWGWFSLAPDHKRPFLSAPLYATDMSCPAQSGC